MLWGFIKGFKSNNKGVTLVELLITITISGVIVAVVVTTHLAQERIYKRENIYMDMCHNAAMVMNRITTTLRMAGYSAPGSSQYSPGIRYGGADSIVVVAADSLEGGDTIAIYTAYKFASQGIDSLKFQYLDPNHHLLTPPVPDSLREDINSVKVTLVLIRDEETAGPARYELSREVKLRN
ncbi:MAG: prepilin-type N-terminal cleavage/methylation domain-containing protein [candidate division WOR-3 bacterium]|nr:prepilin-type N-terminal cleavage/methylation domain-containing protein [candidate division WOR-3 bacterium]